MTKRDDRVSIQQMLDHAKEAIAIASKLSKEEFCSSRISQLALVRLVEIVGECANRVSTEHQKSLPEIPWRSIVAMRNRLIHGYDSVDLEVLWQTLRVDLPELIEKLQPQ